MNINQIIFQYDEAVTNHDYNKKKLRGIHDEIEIAKKAIETFTARLAHAERELPQMETLVKTEAEFIAENKIFVAEVRPLLATMIKLDKKKYELKRKKELLKEWKSL